MIHETNCNTGEHGAENSSKFAQYMVNDFRENTQEMPVRSFKTMARHSMCNCLGREKITVSVESVDAFWVDQYCSGCGQVSNRNKSGASSLADFLRRVLTPQDFQMLINDMLKTSIRENEGMMAFMMCEESEIIRQKYVGKVEALADIMEELDLERGAL